MKSRKHFCEISPTTFYISSMKEVLIRHFKNLVGKEKYATTFQAEPLPVVVYACNTHLRKIGPGIDPVLQENKAKNIQLACRKMNGVLIKPGETLSFWRLVGKTSKRNGFHEGRVLVNDKLVAGVGGGLCNLANIINRLALHSPMTITELHHHSDALAPDPEGKRTPYSAGTSVNYNYKDYRFRNDTDQPVQLLLWSEENTLFAELRTTKTFPFSYRITEEDHHFQLEEDGKYYRVSRIYRETIDHDTGEIIKRELRWDNHSEVMFDYGLIPKDQIKALH